MATLINCTPHVLNIHCDGTCDEKGIPIGIVTLQPSGIVPRVSIESDVYEVTDEGVPLSVTSYGKILDLPDSQPEIVLVTSLIVATAAVNEGRTDVVSPGPLVRNNQGQPIGCMGLSRPSQPSYHNLRECSKNVANCGI